MKLNKKQTEEIIDWLAIAILIIIYSAYQKLGDYKNIIFITSIIIIIRLSIRKSLKIKKTDVYLALFIITTITYAILSYFEITNRSWTEYFNKGYIVSHYAGYLAFFTAYFFFRERIHLLTSLGNIQLLIIILLISILSFYFENVYEYNIEKHGYTLANFNTMEIFRQLFIAILLVKNMKKRLFILIAIAISLLSASIQHIALLFILTVTYFTGKTAKKTIPILFLIALAFPFITAGYWLELHSIDHNTGLRAAFWNDALIAIKDTNYLGVGLGTESVKTQYHFYEGEWKWLNDSDQDVIPIGMHNEIIQTFFRFGALGLFFLILWIKYILFRKDKLSKQELFIHNYAALLLIVSLSTNTAISSPNFAIGTALLMSILSSKKIFS